MKKKLLPLLCFISITCCSQNFAVNFDGADDYIVIPDNNAIDLSANFTLEAWIYPTGAGSQGTEGGIILNKENSYEIARFTNGTIQFALSANGAGSDWGWTNTGLVAPLNQWSHIALVKSGTTVTAYLNGITPVATGSLPATLTANTQTLRIAGRTNVSHYFNGNIDEVRIWNTARTQTEIRTYLFNKDLSLSASGLVAYYRMNAGSGTSAVNSCTNTTGINGTLTNGPTWPSSPVQFAKNALAFDGTDDYVNIPDDNTLDITSTITLEAWVYATKNSGIQNVISKSSNTANNGYIFPRTDNGWTDAVFYLHAAGGWRTLSAPYPSLNAWHHLAATYDGSTMKLYIDGVLAGTRAQTGTITVNANPLVLGNQFGFSELFGGYADDFRVWNVARSATEIQNNMNKELNPAAETGLVSYYTSNQGIAAGTNTGLITLPDQKGTNNGMLTNFTLTGTSSNYRQQNSSLVTLPLKWLSFTAQIQNEQVLLNWSTADEQHTKDFIVQHSVNSSDWYDLSNITAAGNNIGTNNYSYLHAAPADGINYYRIQQRDIDNKSSFSTVRSVKLSDNQSVFSVINNPVINHVLQVQVKKPALLSLYDMHGKLLLKRKVPGTERIDLSLHQKGLYLLKANGQKMKIVVQ